MEDFSRALHDQGMPEEMLWLMNELSTIVLDGRNSQPTSVVEEALGRLATDFSEYLQKVMATGAWDRRDQCRRHGHLYTRCGFSR